MGEQNYTEGKKSEKPEELTERKQKGWQCLQMKWTNSEIKFGIWEY